MNDDTKNTINAWKIAAQELGIEVVAPFRFEVDGRQHECLAWVANFGCKRGIVLAGIHPPEFASDRVLADDAERGGYSWSAINVRVYRAFDREKFIEALADWGFKGPDEARPDWL